MKNQQIGILLLLAAIITAIPVAMTAPTIKASSTKHFDIFQNNSTGGICSGQANCFNLTSPGPTMTVNQGDTVAITVHNNDGIAHTFTIATYVTDKTYNPHTTQSVSPFVASTSGTFKYECTIHPNDMFGNLIVNKVSSAPITPASLLALLGTTTAAVFIAIKRRR